MSIKPLALIIEDNDNIRNFVSIALTTHNYQVDKAKTGKEGLSLFTSHSPDIILLDLGLPDIDGLEILKNIREQSNTPVIVNTARGNEQDMVVALDLGADYIAKPFTTSELLARMRMAMRCNPNFTGDSYIGKAVIMELEIDYEKQEVTLSGQKIDMTPVEYNLIALLSKNAGKVLTNDFIIREIWGTTANGLRALHTNMANIRRKIEINPAMPKYILAEIGVGYRIINPS